MPDVTGPHQPNARMFTVLTFVSRASHMAVICQEFHFISTADCDYHPGCRGQSIVIVSLVKQDPTQMSGDIRCECERPGDANSCNRELAPSCSLADRSGLTHERLAICRRLSRFVAAVVAVALFATFATVTTPGTARAMDWNETKELVRTEFPDAPQVSISGLAKDLETQSIPPLVIDVRDAEEYAVSHLPGAVHAQGSKLERLVRETGAQRPVVLYCSVGYRSSHETEKLRRKGYSNVSNLEGSIFEWANAGKPLVRGGPQSQIPTDAVHPFNETWGVLLDTEHRSYAPRVD